MNKYSKKSIWALILVIIPIIFYIFSFSLLSFQGLSGTIAFAFVFIGPWVFSFSFIISLILGVISLKNIKVSNGGLKGKVFAVTAIIIDVIVIVAIPFLIVVLRSSWS